MPTEPSPSSFRDPAGRVYVRDGNVVRVIRAAARADFDQFQHSGLYQRLVDRGLLIPHHEIPPEGWEPEDCWKVIRPEPIPFISYSSEWCFSQLKDAALAVLAVQQEALRCRMMLKDAPAGNIQFREGRPVLIDTLSFVPAPADVWPAYYQFCKHFVAPLLLAAYRGATCLRWLAIESDGMPLELASALLPWRSRLRALGLWHVHLHSLANRMADSPPVAAKNGKSSGLWRQSALAESLQRGIEKLQWKAKDTQWSTYEDDRPTYSPEGWAAKSAFVERVLAEMKPGVVWDLGMATGHFSRAAAATGALTIGFDADAACVEKAYLQARDRGDRRFLPLVQDLLRPTTAGGWGERESRGLSERGPADLLLALGLTHHLAVKGGVPFCEQLRQFARLSRMALVELIPSTDPVVRAWSARFDVRDVDRASFEASVAPFFTIAERFPIPSSERVLYLLRSV